MKVELNWPSDGTMPPSTQFDVPFLQGMLDRMAMSYFKYGNMRDPGWAKRTDMIANMGARVDKYLDTKNREFLMDVANFAMIEFVNPSMSNTFFKATDGDESPGVVNVETGEFTQNLHSA